MGDTAWEELQRQQYAAMSDAYQRGREDALREAVAWLRECYSIHRKKSIPLPDWYDAADALERREHEVQTLHTSKPSVEDSYPEPPTCPVHHGGKPSGCICDLPSKTKEQG